LTCFTYLLCVYIFFSHKRSNSKITGAKAHLDASKDVITLQEKIFIKLDNMETIINNMNTNLNEKINTMNTNLNEKMNTMNTNLNEKINTMNIDLGNRITETNTKVNGIIVGLFVGFIIMYIQHNISNQPANSGSKKIDEITTKQAKLLT